MSTHTLADIQQALTTAYIINKAVDKLKKKLIGQIIQKESNCWVDYFLVRNIRASKASDNNFAVILSGDRARYCSINKGWTVQRNIEQSDLADMFIDATYDGNVDSDIKILTEEEKQEVLQCIINHITLMFK